MTNLEQEAILALEALRADLEKIQACEYKGINIFNAVGMQTQEVKHSAFMAWLLDTKAQHGLNNLFLKKFTEMLFTHPNRNDPEPNLKSNADILAETGITADTVSGFINAPDIKVDTERVIIHPESRIDIFLSSQSAKKLMVIENKVFTSTHDEQLTRYKREVDEYRAWDDYKKIYVYLTPLGDHPYELKPEGMIYNADYCVFSYIGILNIINEIKKDLPKDKNSLKLKFLMEDYVEMVDANILNTSSELRALCNEIRRKHKDALEILMNYTDIVDTVIVYCKNKITSILSGVSAKTETATRFDFSKDQISYLFGAEEIALGANRCKYLFRISGTKGDIVGNMFLEKEDGAEWSETQKQLAEFYNIKTENKGKYCTLFSVKILDEEDRQRDFEEIKSIVDDGLTAFIQKIQTLEDNFNK